MKIKNFIAIAMVFATLFGLCACGKVKSNTVVETSEVLYVQGEDGQQYTIKAATDNDTGETEYFYYDSESKRVVIEAETDAQGTTKFYQTNDEGNKVEVTTKTETVTYTKVVTTTKAGGRTTTTKKSTTNNGSQDEFIEGLTGALEDYTDAPTTSPSFILGSGTHELANATTVEVSLDSNGNPVQNSEAFFENLAKKDKYTVKAVNRTESNGVVTTTPITIIKSGSKLYFEASAPVDESGSTMTMFIIVDSAAKTCNAYIPSARVTTSIPYDSVDEMMGEFGDLDQSASEGEYLGTVRASINGKVYDVAMYVSDDGSTAKYYYDNGTPVRVEVKGADGSVSITEYTISYTANESKLKAPTGYIQADAFSDMM